MNERLHITLLHDLGKKYNPSRALDFLKSLEKKQRTGKEIKSVENLEKLVKSPKEEDTTLHIIYQTPFVKGEIVIAGKKTRRENPSTQLFPIHFKKTYLQKLSRWETSPQHESKMTYLVWKHFQEVQGENIDNKTGSEPESLAPMPLGSNDKELTFRSELIEGKSIGALMPFSKTTEINTLTEQILEARKNFGSIKETWGGLEEANEVANCLHAGGFLHNDLHRENILLRKTKGSNGEDKFKATIIDFETTEEDERFNTLEWGAACKEDKKLLLEEAAMLLLCHNPTLGKINEVVNTNSTFFKDVEAFSKSNNKILNITKALNNKTIENRPSKNKIINEEMTI
jgi:hypothetical protein